MVTELPQVAPKFQVQLSMPTPSFWGKRSLWSVIPLPLQPKSSTSERGQDIFAFSVLWALKCLLN